MLMDLYLCNADASTKRFLSVMKQRVVCIRNKFYYIQMSNDALFLRQIENVNGTLLIVT